MLAGTDVRWSLASLHRIVPLEVFTGPKAETIVSVLVTNWIYKYNLDSRTAFPNLQVINPAQMGHMLYKQTQNNYGL